ncbi:cupin domain-containing protein [Frateuria aurantia]
MPDRLAALFEHFSVTAQVFNTGALCGINDLSDADTGQLHLISRGEVDIFHDGKPAAQIREPSLLLYPRPRSHRFVTDSRHGADFACAHLRFDGGVSHPVAAALPEFVCLPLADIDGARNILEVLFDEAISDRCGRQALLDRLFEVVLIQVLRQLMESRLVKAGLLAGLSHERLRHALVAIHAGPEQPWTLERLAKVAGMSRTVFVNTFHEVIGITPGQYLQKWRISLAQLALQRGQSLKLIADAVGYSSEAALSRAFKTQTGSSPREWRQSFDSRS